MRNLTPKGIIGLSTTAFLFFILTSLIYFNDQVEFNAVEAKWELADDYQIKDVQILPVNLIDLSNVTYDNISYSVNNQTNNPLGLAFNNDGTKMFIAGESEDRIFEYSLLIPFNLSNVIYNQSFNVSSQESNPYDLSFNDSGTKLYIIGLASKTVYQYSLSIAFDLSTASYDNKSFNVQGQSGTPLNLTFNNDGTKMYVGDTNNQNVFQYSLSTAFDISTVSYDNVSVNLSSQVNSISDLVFNNDGTQMIINSPNDNSVFRYSLSNGFDLSTVSYDNVSFSFSDQDNQSFDLSVNLAFNNDATKMFMSGNSSNTIYQYTLIEPVLETSIDSYQVFENIRNNTSTINPLGFMNTLVSIPAQAVGYYDAFTDFVTGGFGIFDIPDMTFSELADTWWARLPIIYDKFNERYGPLGD